MEIGLHYLLLPEQLLHPSPAHCVLICVSTNRSFTLTSHAVDFSFQIVSRGSHTVPDMGKDVSALALYWPRLLLTVLIPGVACSTRHQKGMASGLPEITDLQSHHCSHWTSDSVAESDPWVPEKAAGTAKSPGHASNTFLTVLAVFGTWDENIVYHSSFNNYWMLRIMPFVWMA